MFDIIIVPTSRQLDFSVSFHCAGFVSAGRNANIFAFLFPQRFCGIGVVFGHTRLTCLDVLLLGFLYLIFKYLYNNTQLFLISYKICMAEWSCINVLQCDNR